jgi:hypothetical protein
MQDTTLTQYLYFKQLKGGALERYFGGQSIRINDNQHVKISVISATIFNTIPNITTSNNTLIFTYNSTTYTIEVDTGIYDINTLNQFIKTYMTNNNLLISSQPLFVLLANNSTQKVNILFNGSVSIDFVNSTIRDILGFNQIIVNGVANQIISANNTAAFNIVNQLLLHCNIVNSIYTDNIYNNTEKSNILATIPLNSQIGYQTLFEPLHPVEIYVNADTIQYLNLYWTDEQGRDLSSIIVDPWTVLIKIHNE